MFDDFVQSSSQTTLCSSSRPVNPAYGSSTNGSFPPSDQFGIKRGVSSPTRHTASLSHGYDLIQDGFEHDDRPQSVSIQPNQALDPIAALETGFVSSDVGSSSSVSPIFQLGRVQYAFTAPLALMTVSSNILTMCLFTYPTASNAANSVSSIPPKLVRINLDDPEHTEEVDVPIPPAPRATRNQPTQDPTTIGPHKMFTDSIGKHLILTMRNGDNYYWASGWKKARLLPKLKGLIIESVAWNKFAPASTSNPSSKAHKRKPTGLSSLASTREILIGTRSGDIYELVITAPVGTDPDEGDFFDKLARRTAGGGSDRADVDRVVRHMFTLPERQPITGLTAEPFLPSFPDSTAKKRRKAVVIATTSTRIYEFIGVLTKAKSDENESQSLYEKLFEPYRGDAMPNLKSELPGDLPYSELHTWTQADHRQSSALAWLTGPGIYHGLLSYHDQDVGDSVIDSANLLPYPAIALEEEARRQSGIGLSAPHTIAEIPLSIALTEFHFILLYRDRVMAISALDDHVIFEETLPLKPNERVIGTAVDLAKGTFWVYTDSSIFELVVRDEDRHVWKIYLERGSFDSALKYAKPGIQRGLVLSSQGDRFFSEARYIQAAQCYAQTFMRSFEEIVLRFIDSAQRDALRYYLVMRLERLHKSDVSQRIMLATWLVEIYLGKINQLEDIAAAEAASQDVENYKVEKDVLTEELYQFLSTYKDILNPKTTYELINKHGRADVLLQYASVTEDYDRIICHHIQQQDWAKAIETLGRQSSVDLYYRYASTLMRHVPSLAVECWTRQPYLQPRRLIPALLQHKADTSSTEDNQAVRYLKHIIKSNRNVDPAIHNLLLTLLAKAAAQTSNQPNAAKDELLSFIDTAKSNPLTRSAYFDLDYALRICSANGQKEACVRIYAKMGLYESAVDLAIRENEIELACSCAEMVENDKALKKKLWLKVAKSVVRSTDNIKSAMQFLRRTDLISIEDMLPFFPDFVVIDDCKDEICTALEGYAAHIEELKDEMDEASRSAAAIQQDIGRLSERFVSIDPDQKCSQCHRPLMQRQFYVFPCRHGFHADCLIGQVTKTMPTRSLRKLLELQQHISSLTSGLVPALPSSILANMGFLKDGTKVVVNAANGARQGLQAGARGLGNVTAVVGLDRLREMVVPDAILSAISAGVSVSVAGGRRVLAPLDPFSNPTSEWVAGSSATQRRIVSTGLTDPTTNQITNTKLKPTPRSIEDQERIQHLRDQLDALIAGSCLLCDGVANAIARPFVSEKENLEEWAL